MLHEGFLLQSRHTVGQLVLKRCNLYLEEDPNRNLLAPLERFQQSISLFRISLISHGGVRDSTIITRLLELVQPRCLRWKIIACVPLFRVDVIVGRTSLENVDERASTVLNCRAESRLQVSHVKRVASRDERVSRSNGHRDRVNSFDNRWGRHCLRLQTFRKCRRGLSLSQAVDTVVVKHVCEVEISSSRVDEMSCPNSQPVTVSTDSNDRQAGIRQLGSRRDRQDSAVQSVETVRVNKVGSLARASDTGE